MNDGETGTALVSMGEQGDIGVATSTRDRITFLVKANGSYTKKLLDTAGTLTGRKVFLNGPYGRSWLAVEDYSNVLCIAGGVGITAILPFAELAVAAGKAAPKNVRLAWSSRSQELISHLEERLTRLKSAGCECDIHCTADSQTMDLAGEEGGGALIDNGRIDLDSVFEKCKEEAFGGKDTLFPSVAVFCCGPPGLSTAVTNLCRKYSSLQVSFQLHDETFFL